MGGARHQRPDREPGKAGRRFRRGVDVFKAGPAGSADEPRLGQPAQRQPHGASLAPPPAAVPAMIWVRRHARVAIVILLLVGACLAVLALADSSRVVRASTRDLSLALVASSGAVTVLSLGASLLTWRAAVTAVTHQVSVGTAARIFFIGQLGKYLPGSVWAVVMQMELAARHGLQRSLVAVASVLSLAIGVPVALLLGLLAVPALLSAQAPSYLVLFLALPIAVIVLSPSVLNPVLAAVLRLARRPALPKRLSARGIFWVAAHAVVAHVLLGIHIWLLAQDLGADGLSVAAAIGVFSLASFAGLVVVPVPAGAGVREAVLVVALSPVLPLGQALVLALLSRALLTAGDLLVGGITAVVVGARRTSTSAT